MENTENIYEENVGMDETAETVAVVEEMPEVQQSKDKTLAQMWQKAKNIPKVIWLSAIAGITVLAIVLVVISLATNTYKTPLNLEYKYLNNLEGSDYFKNALKMWNNFSEDELSEIIRIYKKSDRFEEYEEYLQDMMDDQVENYIDKYGEDYKFSYKIEDKEKLDSDDLKEMRNEFKEAAKNLKEIIEETEEYDSDDWEDMADDLGVSKSEAKKLVKAIEALYEKWKSVDVTKGYELSIISIVDGKELDEPEENERTVRVYKVNGRWISETVLSSILYLLYF